MVDFFFFRRLLPSEGTLRSVPLGITHSHPILCGLSQTALPPPTSDLRPRTSDLRPSNFQTSAKRLFPLVPTPTRSYTSNMSKAELLQAKAATLSEPVAAEILDFLEFVTARRRIESARQPEKILQIRGAFKGQLSSSEEFASHKSDEIRLEK